MPKSKPLRLVIDTNLWISYLISKRLIRLDSLLFSENTRLLFSEDLIHEIEAVILKPKLRKYFLPGALDEMLAAFEPFIDFIEVKSKIEVCRDVKDNFLLALAKDGDADYLITGDSDLLSIKKYEEIKILTFAEFIASVR